MRRYAFAVAGYYGFGNLGDELLAQSCVKYLMELGVSQDRILLVYNSVKSEGALGAFSQVNRWSLPKLWKALRSSETVLLGGGGLFQDVTSSKSLAYYWGLLKLAKLAGCQVLAVGQSIGPIKGKIASRMAYDSFKSCDAIFVRDSNSFDWLSTFSLLGELSPDLVLGLDFERMVDESEKSGVHDRVLINLRPWDGKLEREAALAFEALDFGQKVEKVGLAMAEEDRALLEGFCEEGILSLDKVVLLSDDTVASAFSGGRWVFCMRLHCAVLALLANVPCTAVPYDPKVVAFMSSWGGALWTPGDRVYGSLREPERPWRKRHNLEDARREVRRMFEKCISIHDWHVSGRRSSEAEGF